MLDHSTFIVAAYGTTAVILAWCALAPVLRGRSLRDRLERALGSDHSGAGR